MYKLAVLGHPIAHSLSPQIHKQFAAQYSIELNYQKILVPLDQFQQTAEYFIANGGFGFNVTVPFKVTAYDWLKQHTQRAHAAGSVNTVVQKAEGWIGDNTDGIGFVRDCQKKHIALTNQTIIIMGSGGAARGIVSELLTMDLAELIIVCRDTDAAARIFSKNITILSYSEIEPALKKADVIIDATSDFHRVKDTLSIFCSGLKDVVLYDLKYSLTQQTPLAVWASAEGFRVYDGLGMLIEQAAEAFYEWFQLRPDTQKLCW